LKGKSKTANFFVKPIVPVLPEKYKKVRIYGGGL
jgi:hypothetical protein